METAEVKRLIEAGLEGCEAFVEGDGRHFEAKVVSQDFEGKSPLQKQRMVMDTVKTQLQNDTLHALSIKTFTPKQWSEQQ